MAISLQGGRWGLLSPIWLFPMLMAVAGGFPRFESAICSGVFGLAFYATVFRGLLGPWDGMFGGVWMILFVSYAALHLVACLLFGLWARHRPIAVWWVLPPAVAAYEYLRHVITWSYDRCGLTFCLLGQSVADLDLLRQCADIGGIWLLSYLVALGAATIACCATRRSTTRQRLMMCGWCAVTTLAACLYGATRNGIDGSVAAHVILIPDRFDEQTIARIRQRLATPTVMAASFPSSGRTYIVGPETALIWHVNAVRESTNVPLIQESLLQLTADFPCTSVVGAWIQGERGEAVRNAVVIGRDGGVIAVIDKQHPVPFVEGRPPGTNWLIENGLIPLGAIRNLAPRQEVDKARFHEQAIHCIPGVCYDVFFSQTFREFPSHADSLIVCCLDETFDTTGVFQQLSRVHTRIRAVEFRRPIVRCSLGGLSAVYDGNGHSVDPQSTADGMMTYEIPGADCHSLSATYGNWFAVLCLILVIGVSIESWLRPVKRGA